MMMIVIMIMMMVMPTLASNAKDDECDGASTSNDAELLSSLIAFYTHIHIDGDA